MKIFHESITVTLGHANNIQMDVTFCHIVNHDKNMDTQILNLLWYTLAFGIVGMRMRTRFYNLPTCLGLKSQLH